jgi:two-component system response regulator TctD
MNMKRDERVLIVEDNPLIARAIEEAGTRLQMQSDHAEDGWSAIEMLETEDYAAIVIDADLPRHSGFGVLTYLREEIGDDLGHVLLMTSSDDEQFRRKLPSEAVRVIRKTSEVADIERAMRRE